MRQLIIGVFITMMSFQSNACKYDLFDLRVKNCDQSTQKVFKKHAKRLKKSEQESFLASLIISAGYTLQNRSETLSKIETLKEARKTQSSVFCEIINLELEDISLTDLREDYASIPKEEIEDSIDYVDTILCNAVDSEW